MATFPALAPSTRSYSFGEYPVTTEAGFGGGSVRFLHNTTPNGITLDLTFNALTQANAALIRDHYRGQDGTHVSFELPDKVWIGQSSASNITASTTYWRYAQPPSEEHLEIGHITIAVQLVAVLQ